MLFYILSNHENIIRKGKLNNEKGNKIYMILKLWLII